LVEGTSMKFLALILLVTAIGCHRPPSDSRRALALAPSRGSNAVDRDLAAARTRAEKEETPEAWVRLAQSWVRKARVTADPGFMLSADAAAQLALAQSPRFRPALDVEALALLGAHRFREAIAVAGQVLAGDPDDLMALGALSDAQLELGDVAGAARSAQRMMDVKPSLPSYGRASYLRWLSGDEAGAREMIRLAIDAGRGGRDREPSAWVLVQAAMLFWHAGDLEGADAGFVEALRQQPGYPPALVGAARVAVARGDGATALSLLERAVAASPTVEALALLADARTLAGQSAEPVVARLVREGRRGDRLGLGSFLAAHGKETVEAVSLLETERRERPGLAVEDAYAWALYRAGRLSEARQASDRARAFGTPDARWLFHAGAIRLAQGQTSEGRALLQAALARNPHFDLTGAAEASALLAGAVAKR
jgi:tetratricopeptide (TPR) repeat protein